MFEEPDALCQVYMTEPLLTARTLTGQLQAPGQLNSILLLLGRGSGSEPQHKLQETKQHDVEPRTGNDWRNHEHTCYMWPSWRKHPDVKRKGTTVNEVRSQASITCMDEMWLATIQQSVGFFPQLA